MGWATDIHACTTSASPPPEGSPQGARPPAPDSGFPATRTADFLANTVVSPDNRDVSAEPTGEAYFSYAWLTCVDPTTLNHSITVQLDLSRRSMIGVASYGAEIPPIGLRLPTSWRCKL